MARGLAASREQARDLVLAGRVLVGGAPAAKPARMVAPAEPVLVQGPPPPFVGRGGHKLAAALDRFAIEVAGRRAIDVGASTGGFTDCLLQRGAAAVVALDVAYGELDWALRGDERVTVLERTNARSITPADLPYAPDLVVADVSFISLTKILPAVLACCGPRFDALVMIKPQFEVGRERVGKGGVVRDPDLRAEAVATVARFARERCGAAVVGFAPSGLPGPKGNVETFAWLAEGDRPGAIDDVDAALAEVAV